jgi:hypothetical protein
MNVTDIVTQLLWPETKQADDQDRDRARLVIANGAEEGRISEGEAGRREAAVTTAVTRADLHTAMRDLDGAQPAAGLASGLRVATAVWVLTTVVELTVWLAIAVVSGDLDSPWWLFSAVVGGGIVAAIRVAHDARARAPFHGSRSLVGG